MSTIKMPCHDFRGKASTLEILPHRYYDGEGEYDKEGRMPCIKDGTI